VNILNILNNIQGWFVHFKVYINSPTIIMNLAKSIEKRDAYGDVKKEVTYWNAQSGLREAFDKYLKDKGIS
jgi:hypothetical protein